MPDLALFVIGVLVTVVVSIAVGLIGFLPEIEEDPPHSPARTPEHRS